LKAPHGLGNATDWPKFRGYDTRSSFSSLYDHLDADGNLGRVRSTHSFSSTSANRASRNVPEQLILESETARDLKLKSQAEKLDVRTKEQDLRDRLEQKIRETESARQRELEARKKAGP
jgi:hypothetical protein